VQIPFSHPAKVSQVVVGSFAWHGCPSAMTVGQVPASFVGHAPSPATHSEVALQGAPGDAHCRAVQAPPTQISDAAQSMSVEQGAPEAPPG
jgi:hypothetical protein